MTLSAQFFFFLEFFDDPQGKGNLLIHKKSDGEIKNSLFVFFAEMVLWQSNELDVD